MTYEQVEKSFEDAKSKDELSEAKANAIVNFAQTSIGISLIYRLYEKMMVKFQ